jgi:hypothetical protein
MSESHTPGPWTVHKTTNLPVAYYIGPASRRHLALVFNEADARLIAAAPDLLAALKDLSRLADAIYVRMSDGEMALMRDAWGKADAAIAKAEGRS